MGSEYLKQYMYYDYLSHHGVKGMKWGVIREKINGAWRLARYAVKKKSHKVAKKLKAEMENEKAEDKKRDAEIIKKSKKLKNSSKEIKSLSDSELKARIDRLNLEKQLKDLEKNSKSGFKVVGEKLFISAVEKIGANTIDWAVGRIFNSSNNSDLTIEKLNRMDLTKAGPEVLKKAADLYTKFGTTQKIRDTYSTKRVDRSDTTNKDNDTEPFIDDIVDKRKKAIKNLRR